MILSLSLSSPPLLPPTLSLSPSLSPRFPFLSHPLSLLPVSLSSPPSPLPFTFSPFLSLFSSSSLGAAESEDEDRTLAYKLFRKKPEAGIHQLKRWEVETKRSDGSLAMTLRLKHKRAADEGACDVKMAPTGRERNEGGMGEGVRDAGGMERERREGQRRRRNRRKKLIPPPLPLFLMG